MGIVSRCRSIDAGTLSLPKHSPHQPFKTRQVLDDILDVTQTTEQLGKTAGKDLASAKTTYPSLLGIEKSREVAKELVSDALA